MKHGIEKRICMRVNVAKPRSFTVQLNCQLTSFISTLACFASEHGRKYIYTRRRVRVGYRNRQVAKYKAHRVKINSLQWNATQFVINLIWWRKFKPSVLVQTFPQFTCSTWIRKELWECYLMRAAVINIWNIRIHETKVSCIYKTSAPMCLKRTFCIRPINYY